MPVSLGVPRFQAFDNNGDPLVGGKLYTYEAGTTTPKASYTSAAGTTPNANPVVLNARGEATVYYGTGAYKLVLETATGVTVWTEDNVSVDSLRDDLASTAAGKGAALVGFLPTGTGATPTTVQAALDLFNQKTTGFHFVGNGAKIHRINDRLFICGATVHDGAFPVVTDDWLGNLTASWVSGKRNSGSAVLSVLTHPNNKDSAQAILGAAQTKNFGAPNAAAIGISGYAINNHATFAEFAWGGYFEAHRENDVVKGSVGIEINVWQGGALAATNPYNATESGVPEGYTLGLQLASGAARGGGSNNTAAMVVTNNGNGWDKGIIFFDGSLSGTAKAAICMPTGYTVRWWASGTEQTSTINCVSTTRAASVSLVFQNNSATFQNSADNTTLFYVTQITGATNYVGVTSSNGLTPNVYVAGASANIDLQLVSKGTGVVQFGTYTAGVVSQAGYITVKDSGGTTRRLLVG